ncbi:hypothetical protein LO771_01285 [Streptacidiphilus sp. ASG 303]|uniref:hypothetical protein n=1 Tax=Streptacidiphilus sp. ASG 303 TaxID=2896847 RepID=UPI001E3979D9|nr:hypothetical protein [Streptacidiphilus sp. ASG 303]MCD0481079.1 hypothetical protein [Streptacidiphilus sp. ASG 303]
MVPPHRTPRTSPLGTRLPGAVLCLAVAAVHVVDQGGIPGSKDPSYIGVGYHALEIAAVLAAVLLLAGAVRTGWLLAAGVALGPILGYVLSRGPGLPDYHDDVGNWGEPLGVASLVVEGLLLVLALAAPGGLLRRPARAAPGVRQGERARDERV